VTGAVGGRMWAAGLLACHASCLQCHEPAGHAAVCGSCTRDCILHPRYPAPAQPDIPPSLPALPLRACLQCA
jgi:hypothetical protein